MFVLKLPLQLGVLVDFECFYVTLRINRLLKLDRDIMIGIDLFSGAGGMSLGASLAGIDVQLVVETDKCAALTYL